MDIQAKMEAKQEIDEAYRLRCIEEDEKFWMELKAEHERNMAELHDEFRKQKLQETADDEYFAELKKSQPYRAEAEQPRPADPPQEVVDDVLFNILLELRNAQVEFEETRSRARLNQAIADFQAVSNANIVRRLILSGTTNPDYITDERTREIHVLPDDGHLTRGPISTTSHHRVVDSDGKRIMPGIFTTGCQIGLPLESTQNQSWLKKAASWTSELFRSFTTAISRSFC